MEASKAGNGRKCNKSMWLNENWEKEPKECVAQWELGERAERVYGRMMR